jgi:hypothetical protein
MCSCKYSDDEKITKIFNPPTFIPKALCINTTCYVQACQHTNVSTLRVMYKRVNTQTYQHYVLCTSVSTHKCIKTTCYVQACQDKNHRALNFSKVFSELPSKQVTFIPTKSHPITLLKSEKNRLLAPEF